MKRALTDAEMVPVPVEDKWRISYLWKLLNKRLKSFYNGEEDERNYLTSLINSLVVN